jgi:hypothetical protein
VAEVYERPTAIEVTIWPEDAECLDAFTWCVTVAYRGRGKWAVLRGDSGSRVCLGRDGKWDHEPSPSSRDDDWLADHRFGKDEALALAREWAPKVDINGYEAVEVLARHRMGLHG